MSVGEGSQLVLPRVPEIGETVQAEEKRLVLIASFDIMQTHVLLREKERMNLFANIYA